MVPDDAQAPLLVRMERSVSNLQHFELIAND